MINYSFLFCGLTVMICQEFISKCLPGTYFMIHGTGIQSLWIEYFNRRGRLNPTRQSLFKGFEGTLPILGPLIPRHSFLCH
jgi:hypothetical protein